jgi:hypothetical protein
VISGPGFYRVLVKDMRCVYSKKDSNLALQVQDKHCTCDHFRCVFVLQGNNNDTHTLSRIPFISIEMTPFIAASWAS